LKAVAETEADGFDDRLCLALRFN